MSEENESTVSITIIKNGFNPGSIFDITKLIRQIPQEDKHHELKVNNLIKLFGHAHTADENRMAKHRIKYYNDWKEVPDKVEEYRKDRVEKHGAFAESWFREEGNNIKIRHFYQSPKPKNLDGICDGETECLCWKHDYDFSIFNYEAKQKEGGQ